MIQSSFRLARFRGIDIGVHYSWFIILVLLTASLGWTSGTRYAAWTTAELYVVALLSSLLLFGWIVLHESAHSLVALAKGIPVRSITLFVFGGVTRMSREPDRPRPNSRSPSPVQR
jgi:Zn-dependent protease